MYALAKIRQSQPPTKNPIILNLSSSQQKQTLTQTPHAKPPQTHTRTRIIIIILLLIVIHKALALGIQIIPRLQQAINFPERLVAMALEGPLAVLRGVRGGGVDIGGTGA